MGAIRTLSCGCCTNGCYCFMHRPDRPAKGLSFVCEYHAETSHPHVTSPFATEPTDQGNQYVIPGCEKDRSRGPAQGDLF